MQALQELAAARIQDRADMDQLREQTNAMRALLERNVVSMSAESHPSKDDVAEQTLNPGGSNVPVETASALNAQPSNPATAPILHRPEPEEPRIVRKPLPMGEPFDGVKAKYPSWRVQIEFKLVQDRIFIGTDTAQFHFIWSCLSLAVQNQVKAFYAMGGYDRAWNPSQFLGYLDFCYKDAHEAERALVQLDNIRQRPNEPFPTFFVRFQTLLAEAGGQGWDDEQILHRLRKSLTPKMRDVSLHRGVSRSDYKSAVAAYESIAVDIETLAMELQYSTTASNNNSTTAPKCDKDGDVVMTTVASTSTQMTRQGGGTGPKRKNWIPDDVFNARRMSGACTRCGEMGHMHRECSNAVSIHAVATQPVFNMGEGATLVTAGKA